MNYKQILEEVREACGILPPDVHYADIFQILLEDALWRNKEPLADDTSRADRAEADTPTDS